jgi:hypothetical protein
MALGCQAAATSAGLAANPGQISDQAVPAVA